MTIATDDSRLLTEYIVSRSSESLGRLIERHIDFVYAAARRQLRDPSLADDVTQAVFIILARKAAGIHPAALSGWLFNTTRHCAANARRAEVRRHRRERLAAKTEATMSSPLASSDDSSDGLSEILDDCIAQLNKSERQVILLRYLRGYELSDIGTTLGVSEQTARKRLTRAVSRLRQFATAQHSAPVTSAALLGMLESVQQHAPLPLLQTSITAAGGHSAALASAHLATKTIHLMTWIKLKIAAAIVMAALVGGTATTVVVHHVLAQKPRATTTFPILTQGSATQPANSPIDPALQKALSTKLPNARFTRNDLGDVLEYVGDVTSLNLYPDWISLNAAGLPKNTPVTYSSPNKTAGQVLNEILARLPHQSEPPVFEAIGNVAIVSTPGRLIEFKKQLAFNSQPPADSAMQQLFDRHLPRLLFNANALADVLEYLRDVTHVNIAADWKALAAAGVDRNAPVSMRLRDVSFRESLTLIIYSANTTTSRILFKTLGNTVVISTEEKLNHVNDLAAEFALGTAEKIMQHALTQTLPEIRFNANSLSDVIDFLRDTTKAKIHVDWNALQSGGISRDTPITLSLRNARLQDVLRLLLDTASTPTAKLDYQVAPTQIIITVTATKPPR